MAKCTISGIRKRSKKKLNVITIQNGIEKQKGSRPHYFSTSSSSSLNLRGSNLSRDDGISETFGTFNDNSEGDCKVVLAITQGRGDATCEVGIAVINITRPSLIMCQISDTLSYTNILTKINIFNPSEILIPATTISNRLTEKIKVQFKNTKILAVPRSTFNSNSGFNYVKRVCASNWNSIILMVQYKYYALTAVSALFSYIENHLYTFYANESIKVEYEESEGYMIIDVLTADKLELVACALPDINLKYSSLRGILNNCLTKIGSRTLRATILQPPCCLTKINARLDCVEELVRNSNKLVSIREILGQLSRIDQLLTLASIMSDRATGCSVRQLNYILLVNSLFGLLKPLSDVFAELQQPYFVELRETLVNKDFDYLKNIVRSVIHENARPAAGEQGMTERCFAIKSGANPILDLIRKRYSARLDELRDYVRQLGSDHNLDLKLSNNVKKGYHIVLKLNKREIKSFKLSSLPDIFIHVERSVSMVTMTTIDIQTFQIRLEDISAEIVKISNVILYKLLIEIHKYVGLFYKLCEQIAKVDMIQALALASSSIEKYVRPKFNEFTEIINGRHPLLEYLSDKDPTANDIFASPQFNMNIVTGPNSAGKSIYIRQIVLLQIMAQIGCFVPASSATFRVADRILARIYLEDDMYCGASAFTLEMKEIKYFFNVMTPNTLIIIDELCRSTAVLEGTGLAMAICEKLLQTPAFIFFTTHYTFITKLYDMYYNVRCWQLETEEVVSGNNRKLVYTHRVLPGVTTVEDYAIQSAKACWPPVVMRDVEAVKQYIEVKEMNASVFKIDPRMRLKYNIEADLQILNYKGQCTNDVVRERMIMYQQDLEKLGTHIDWCHESDPIIQEENEISPNVEEFSNLSYEEMIQPNVVYDNTSMDHDTQLMDSSSLLHLIQPEAVYSNSSVDVDSQIMQVVNNYEVVDSQREMEAPQYITTETGDFYNMQEPTNDCDVISEASLPQYFTPEVVVNEFPQFSSDENKSMNQINREDCITNMQNESFHSFNEFQFAVPLQRHLEKTSTPLVTLNRNRQQNNQQLAKPQTSDIDLGDEESSALHETMEYLESSGYSFEDEFIDPPQTQLVALGSPSINENAVSDEYYSAVESITYSPDYEYLARHKQNDDSDANLEDSTSQNNEPTTKSTSLMNNINSNSHSNVITDGISNTATTSKSTETSQKLSSENTSEKEKEGTSSTDRKLSDQSQQSKRLKPSAKIKPLNKMTKKEIEQEYYERDLKFLNATGEQSVQYSEEILNRPKAKQIKASEQIAIARKSDDGSVVIIRDQIKTQQRRRSKFNKPLRHNVGRQFDVTIFSDENSHIFDEFMQTEQNPKRDQDFFNKVFHKESETSASSLVSANLDCCPNMSFFNRPGPVFNFSDNDKIGQK